jgi:hypothetical protein
LVFKSCFWLVWILFYLSFLVASYAIKLGNLV